MMKRTMTDQKVNYEALLDERCEKWFADRKTAMDKLLAEQGKKFNDSEFEDCKEAEWCDDCMKRITKYNDGREFSDYYLIDMKCKPCRLLRVIIRNKWSAIRSKQEDLKACRVRLIAQDEKDANTALQKACNEEVLDTLKSLRQEIRNLSETISTMKN